MNLRLGSIAAHLVQHTPDHPFDDLAERINTTIRPPTPVAADDIHVRAMYLVSDEVNSFGGRFPVDEHATLLPLLVDVPVMVGHRKDRLPIARTFAAIQEVRDGFNWVKVLFYWMKDADGAQSLADNIDGGVYRECSIGFIYRFPECSVCGEDMRRCSHEPLRTYPIDGGSVTAHYNYRRIERVLECSIVYRGAQANTAITNVLTDADTSAWRQPPVYHSTDDSAPLLVTPFYDGIPVLLSWGDVAPQLLACDGRALPSDMASRFDLRRLSVTGPLFGLLVGYRGRQRCSSDQTCEFLSTGSGRVNRVELKLLITGLSSPCAAGDSRYQTSRLRYRITNADELISTASSLATRDGVRVWRLPDLPPYVPGRRLTLGDGAFAATLDVSDGEHAQIIRVCTPGLTRRLELCGRPLGRDAGPFTLSRFERRGEGYRMVVNDRDLLLRPVILHGRKRYVCIDLRETAHATV